MKNKTAIESVDSIVRQCEKLLAELPLEGVPENADPAALIKHVLPVLIALITEHLDSLPDVFISSLIREQVLLIHYAKARRYIKKLEEHLATQQKTTRFKELQ